MTKIFYSLLVAATLTACGNSDADKTPATGTTETPTETPANPASNLPNLTSIQWLDSTFLDMGTVKEGKLVEAVYRFKNTGTEPLIFSSVTASCGCTVPKKPEAPIAPGETGEIVAAFDSKGRKGENRKNVTVIANTQPSSNFVLEFKVNVQ